MGWGKGEERTDGKGRLESDARGPKCVTRRTKAIGGFLEETRHDSVCVLERQQRRRTDWAERIGWDFRWEAELESPVACSLDLAVAARLEER